MSKRFNVEVAQQDFYAYLMFDCLQRDFFMLTILGIIFLTFQ